MKRHEGRTSGHSHYDIVPVRSNEDAYRCECGWQSGSYHDMTSYAYFEWKKHVEDVARRNNPSQETTR